MPIDPAQVQWDAPDATKVQWDQAPKGPGAPQPLTFAEKYIAPLLESGTMGQILRGIPEQPVRGLMQGAADPAIGAAQIAANVGPDSLKNSVNRAITKQNADYESKRGSDGFDAWRAVGNVASPATAIPLASVPQKASLLAKALTAMAGGAGATASQPVYNAENPPSDFWGEKGNQAAIGAVMGPLGYGLSSVGAGVIGPPVQKAAQTLIDKGVTLTPGGLFGGTAKHLEDSASSIPVLGDFIRNAQRRSFADYNTATVNQALEPLGITLPKGATGYDAIKFADDAIGNAYNKTLDRIGVVQPDQTFTQGIGNLRNLVGELSPGRQQQFDQIIQNKVLSHLNDQGYMTAEAFKRADSQLGGLARTYTRSLASGDDNQFGSALYQAQQELRDTLTRSARNPQDVQDLQAANQAFALFLRPAKAAASMRADQGVFTPEQLNSAVKSFDPTKRNIGRARGEALMQDWSDAGLKTLGNTEPNSGTPYRSMLAALVGGALGGEHLPAPVQHSLPYVAAGIGAASLPYTPIGQKVAQVMLAERPQWAQQMAALLRRGAPTAGALTAPSGYALTEGR